MRNEIVLALMQLKGIHARLITKSIPVSDGMDCTVDNIEDLLRKGKGNSSRVPYCTGYEIAEAIRESQRIMDDCHMLGISIMTFLDKDYPILLKKSENYPAVLYYKGDLSGINNENTVSIVGTREPTAFGYKVAEKLGESFAQRGFTVVSGLARGCDAGAHIGCLKASGKTIAVLPAGLDKIYPASSIQIASDILNKGGALISEYQPYIAPYMGSYIARDRIQAALSAGVFVIETKKEGGTFHAVEAAQKYGRILGAFKHPEKYLSIEQAEGNKNLIAYKIAIPVSNDKDLELFCEKLKKKNKELLTPIEKEPEYQQLSLLDL